jgi:hypothetical protein
MNYKLHMPVTKARDVQYRIQVFLLYIVDQFRITTHRMQGDLAQVHSLVIVVLLSLRKKLGSRVSAIEGFQHSLGMRMGTTAKTRMAAALVGIEEIQIDSVRMIGSKKCTELHFAFTKIKLRY